MCVSIKEVCKQGRVLCVHQGWQMERKRLQEGGRCKWCHLVRSDC
jgi:putative hemolysin